MIIGLMAMETACTSSVRPFNVPNEAGVGAFSFTSIKTNLYQTGQYTTNWTHDSMNAHEWQGANSRQEENDNQGNPNQPCDSSFAVCS